MEGLPAPDISPVCTISLYLKVGTMVEFVLGVVKLVLDVSFSGLVDPFLGELIEGGVDATISRTVALSS